jgi:CheY-like chemotaxis protein
MARKLRPDAITLDLGLDDINGFVLLDLLKHDAQTGEIPIHVVSGADEAEAVTGMGALGVTGKPAERKDLIKLFSRIGEQAKAARRRRGRPKPRPQALRTPASLPELAGARILIVDDDIRNIYSLTSVLESYDVEVLHAERGRDGILILEQTPGIDVALIDIMMPDMDGYETMRQIRDQAELADLPLIAVTAKAMKGDRQKCLDAGASDYIAKPVDIELLLALLRVWIGKVRGRAAAATPAMAQTAAE